MERAKCTLYVALFSLIVCAFLLQGLLSSPILVLILVKFFAYGDIVLRFFGPGRPPLNATFGHDPRFFTHV